MVATTFKAYDGRTVLCGCCGVCWSRLCTTVLGAADSELGVSCAEGGGVVSGTTGPAGKPGFQIRKCKFNTFHSAGWVVDISTLLHLKVEIG